MGEPAPPPLTGIATFIARLLATPFPALLTILAIVIGAVAVWITPREEEPQIVVPLADVFVSAPGFSAAQVERQIATPLENLLYQIDGVEYVYSMAREGGCVVTVRFYVGQNREDSLVKIYNKIYSHTDQIPAAVQSWVVKPVEIDDVPIVVAALWSADPERTHVHELRRLAEEIKLKLQAIPNTNTVSVSGGLPRKIRVELNPEALAARRTSPLEVAWAIGVSNIQMPGGAIQRNDQSFVVEGGTFFNSVDELRRMVVNVVDNVPVYLSDVATILDGPSEPDNYTWLGFGPAAREPHPDRYPAVFVSVAKKKGANAVWVAEDVAKTLEWLKQELFPPEVHYQIIRDYGQTADEKVNDLVASLVAAVLTVVVFIGIFLGWRAAAVVGLAVPVCYGITLGLDLLTGYTINRVTLFALILALGLLVDDPITGVDNIERYFRIGKYPPRQSVALAIFEVRGALIMATVAIVLAFVPMFFITGMMGPYMAPMAFNVPVSVIVSTVVAFMVTPWLAYKMLRHDAPEVDYDVRLTWLYRIYSRLLRPLIQAPYRAWAFLGVILALFVVAVVLPGFRLVPLKLLPYDNKNEFQIVIDMPEGTTLERSAAVASALGDYLKSVPEVEAIATFVGTPSPMDFNGMVRHYYLRQGPHFADLRVTLADRYARAQQSHEILLRIRRDLEKIGAAQGAKLKLVEAPPGPPVIATLTAELYGTETTPYSTLQQAALTLSQRLAREPFVADVDTSVEADQTKLRFVTDKEKAALSGVSTEDIAATLALATNGQVAGFLQLPSEVNPLPIELKLPIDRRSDPVELATLYVKGRPGISKRQEKGGLRDAPQPLVQVGELGYFDETRQAQTLYHKNLERVAYVFAEVTGRPPADVVLDMQADQDAQANQPRPLETRTYFHRGGGDPWSIPADVRVVWSGEGEWQITLQVFRDLGIAYGAALAGIFVVLWVQTGLAALSGIIMLAIPLSVIGIMPGFWLLNHLGGQALAGYPNPVLFTATAMIGMIALAGIVVRNSLILLEFVHIALREGMELGEALVQAGAIRTRPVFLTAGTALLGNLVITLDPIFSGLAWAIIFGLAASTLFTLAVIPVVYYLVYRNQPGHGVPTERITAP